MNDIVKQWIVDAEAFEFQEMYKVKTSDQFDFYKRQDDFYITLLNKMYNTLQAVKASSYESKREELSAVAHAMLTYSDKKTEKGFFDVDKVSNQLYVAAIYFLVGYEAIASLLLRGYDLNTFSTNSARMVFYIVSGAAYKLEDITDPYTKDSVDRIHNFLLNGTDELMTVSSEVERKFNEFSFESLDDFFDTAVLLHVCRKFIKHNLWETLAKYNSNTNWSNYIRYSITQNILSLLPSQEDAVSKGLLTFEKSFSLKMPTSAGKSYITELLIYQEIKNNPDAKILYLAPLRSLSRELKERYIRVGRKLDFTTRAIYGGSTYTIDQSVLDEAQLLISTPETFTTLEETMDEKLSQFSLIICDEGQLLDSLTRGINYELLLTRLKKIKNIRYLFLSAIIPNIEEVNTWLGGGKDEIGDSSYRPCPIRLSYIGADYNLHVKDDKYENDKYVIRRFLSSNEQKGVRGNKKSQASAIALKSLEAGSVLLFTTEKSGKCGCIAIGNEVLQLIEKKNLPIPYVHSVKPKRLEIISEYIKYQFGDSHLLSNYLLKGFAYHHGSLPQDIREVVEQAYAKRIIPLLICTNTLAEGVNMPVQTLVLYNLSRYNSTTKKKISIDATEIKNIVGRTGRAGQQRFGIVVYVGDTTKSTYDNTRKALQNRGLHEIMGTLYNVVRVFTEDKRDLDDETINNILEKNDLATAIDTMITRSVNISTLEDINIEDIVKESLAYYVGTDSIKEDLKRVFQIRHSVITSKLNNKNFEAYHKTGLSIDDITIIEELVTHDTMMDIDIANPISESWTNFAIKIIMSMPSLKNGEIKCHDGKEKRVLREEEVKQLLLLWLTGSQYHEIALKMNYEVENAIGIVLFLQNSFHANASSLVRYIECIGEDITSLTQWVDMIKYGVDSPEKLLLIKSGLTDRIAVNSLFKTPILDDLNFDNKFVLRQSMRDIAEKISNILNYLNIPKLCKERVMQYLN